MSEDQRLQDVVCQRCSPRLMWNEDTLADGGLVLLWHLLRNVTQPHSQNRRLGHMWCCLLRLTLTTCPLRDTEAAGPEPPDRSRTDLTEPEESKCLCKPGNNQKFEELSARPKSSGVRFTSVAPVLEVLLTFSWIILVQRQQGEGRSTSMFPLSLSSVVAGCWLELPLSPQGGSRLETCSDVRWTPGTP